MLYNALKELILVPSTSGYFLFCGIAMESPVQSKPTLVQNPTSLNSIKVNNVLIGGTFSLTAK